MIPIASFFIAVIILLITYINCSKKALIILAFCDDHNNEIKFNILFLFVSMSS